MTKSKQKELEQKIIDLYEKAIKDPNYRKTHNIALSEN